MKEGTICNTREDRSDGTPVDVIFCDAAPNRVERIVNANGKKMEFDNPGWRVGLKSGEYEERFYNTKCPDQFAGECFAVLKAVEKVAEIGLDSVTVRNDRITSFSASTKRGYAGAKYLYVAKKIAEEAGLDVDFEYVPGEENPADIVSRTEVQEEE